MWEYTLDLFSLADYIWILTRNSRMGQVRQGVFKRYCQMEKKEEILEKIKFVYTRELREEWENEFEHSNILEIGEDKQNEIWVKTLLDRKEEENVCILEDDT